MERQRHLERVEWDTRHGAPDLEAWPFTLPVVRQLVAEGGIDVPAGVTVLVGENGSGKSTLIEAIAAVYPRHGVESAKVNLLGPTPRAEDSPLARHLRARTHPLASPAGFFLRAEAMHEYFTEVDSDPAQRRAWGESVLNQRSHGESFLQVLEHRFADPGVYILDEPESALSFQSSLVLLAVLHQLAAAGSQVLMATHSPLLASLSGATVWQLDDDGITTTSYDDLDLVRSWRSFLDDPSRYLRHLLD